MPPRTDIWTYLIITAVSVTIWVVAAGQTRVEQELRLEVVLRVEDPTGNWRLQPETITATVTVEGNPKAVDDAQGILRLAHTVDTVPGAQPIDLRAAIANSQEIRDLALTVISVKPASETITLERLRAERVDVDVVMPDGVEVTDRTTTPAAVTLVMPEGYFAAYGDDPKVEAVVDRRQLERLPPGARHRLQNVLLRLRDRLDEHQDGVELKPSRVTVEFNIRAREVEASPPQPVRIKIAGSPEDKYVVEVEPKQLRDVTVMVPDDLAEEVRDGSAKVFAIVYLTTADKDSGIKSKPVTSFMVLRRDGTVVPSVRTGPGSKANLEIGLTITSMPEAERLGGDGLE